MILKKISYGDHFDSQNEPNVFNRHVFIAINNLCKFGENISSLFLYYSDMCYT